MAKNATKPGTAGEYTPSAEERVEIFIPRDEAGGDQNLYVSVNDWCALLPRGKSSQVPPFAAEEINRSLQEQEKLYAEMERRAI